MPATTEEAGKARKLLGPSEVRLHHIPGWLRLRMLRAFGCGKYDSNGWSVLHHAVGDRRRWLDHIGSTTLSNGRRAFVSEPYGFSSGMAKELEAFCVPMGLDWRVSGNAEWYPGSTVRIVIEEPQK